MIMVSELHTNFYFLTFINEHFCLYIDLFYLESCTKPQIKVESKDLNEHMYLVVRSLKHNNTKIVIYYLRFNKIHFYRNMTFNKEIF
jgi:hypothetical protein